jgi:hypothetical protein
VAWDYYQRVRLGDDANGLRTYFPSFSFYEPTGDTYVSGYWTSNAGNGYGVMITIPPGYPDECPSTYVSYPSPLWGHMGWRTIESYGTSHDMHTWQTDRPGWVKICTYRPEGWSVEHSMLKIIRKGLLWIFAYECHLQDGKPIKNFLMDA